MDLFSNTSSTLEGFLKNIIYQNEAEDYLIANFISKGKEITITGKFYNITPGLHLLLKGKWYTHPKYGTQFKVSEYEVELPKTREGIIRYLSSGIIKGIKKILATRLVTHFGLETIDIINNNPERLKEVSGIGNEKIKSLVSALEKQKEITNVMLFLYSKNIPKGIAKKIYKKYGKEVIEILTQNPYRLSSEISGIGFKTADKIAIDMGFSIESEHRIKSGILFILEEATSEGNIFLPKDILLKKCAELLNIEPDKIILELSKMEKEIIQIGENIYLKNYYQIEEEVANKIIENLQAQKGDIKEEKDLLVKNLIKELEKENKKILTSKQKEVIYSVISEKIIILTGGPGTGKTFTTKVIVKLFQKLNKKVLLCAPTGRAAKKLSESTAQDAKTIHRLLEYNPFSETYNKCEINQLEADLIIVDEFSMIDLNLFYYFLKAVNKNTTLLFIGDVDQLPSVGAGNVLCDLIKSKVIPTIKLDVVFRQEEQSLIIVNAHRINEGKMPILKREINSDFIFIEKNDAQEIQQVIIELICNRLPKYYNYHSTQDIQVISPMYKGELGIDKLNSILQDVLNKGNDFFCGGKTFRERDKVMQIKNNYKKEVYNGDIGFIKEINKDNEKIIVEFPENEIKYDFSEVDELVLSYVISTHKSQGSEYKAVILPLVTQHYILLQRNLLYTAITRAKELVIIIGMKKAIALAINNNKVEKRFTSLAEMLLKSFRKAKFIT